VCRYLTHRCCGATIATTAATAGGSAYRLLTFDARWRHRRVSAATSSATSAAAAAGSTTTAGRSVRNEPGVYDVSSSFSKYTTRQKKIIFKIIIKYIFK